MRRAAAVAAALSLAAAGSAGAQEKQPEVGQKPSAPPEATKPRPPDDFELLPPEKKADPATKARESQIQRDLSRRRTMLQLHTGLGFATIASLGATAVLGQLNYQDKYGGGGDTGKYRLAHRISAYSAAGIFAVTGLLAVLAPSPYDKPLRLDSATLHKASMAVATAGMAAQIVLGILTAGKEGTLAQRDYALAHQIVGYTTLAATTTGFLVLAF